MAVESTARFQYSVCRFLMFIKPPQAKQKQYNSTSQLSNGMSNGMSNFGSKQKLYGSQPKIDSFAEELKQAVSYQSLNTVNEGIWSFN